MYLLIAFLSQTEKVHELIRKMKTDGFTGGTLFDGVGMKRAIPKAFDKPLVASLHSIFEEEGHINKVLLSVVENEGEVQKLTEIIESVMGDLHKPDTGLIIAFKLDLVRGYDRWKDVDM